jgi:hypothetical protein
MKTSACLLALALAACGSSTETPADFGLDFAGDDLAVGPDLRPAPPDLATPPPDLATPPPDLTYLGDLTFVPACMATGSNRQRFVFDTVTLPQSRADYAIDLNGDGRADDQLGNLVAALSAQALNPQPGVDAALAAGTLVELVDETSSDPTFATDGCAESNLYHGQNQAPGTPPQTYQIDTGVAPGRFDGPIASSKFDSSAPSTGPDVQVTLVLPLVGGAPIALPLHGAHLQYTYAAGTNTLTGGQINGAVLNGDVQTRIVPAIAAALNGQIQSMPTSANTMQILAIFDVGGCPGGTAGNRHIEPCEVGTNPIIKNILAPDVQLFQGGVYHPNPANTAKDSFSVGIAFTAVAANF